MCIRDRYQRRVHGETKINTVQRAYMTEVITVQRDIIASLGAQYPDNFHLPGGTEVTYKGRRYVLSPKLLDSSTTTFRNMLGHGASHNFDLVLKESMEVDIEAFDAFMKILFAKKAPIKKTHFIDFAKLLVFFDLEFSSIFEAENEEEAKFDKILSEASPTDENFIKVLEFTLPRYPEVFTQLSETYYDQLLALILSTPREKLRHILRQHTFSIILKKLQTEVDQRQKPVRLLIDILTHYYNQEVPDDADNIDKELEALEFDGPNFGIEDLSQLLRVKSPLINKKKIDFMTKIIFLQSQQYQRLVQFLKEKGVLPDQFN
eukprot:TRINITY_DN159_c0_g1_i2.p1 TRINITY_DN159_c0_g1~~TRINITY_DN159_c0_g1_i2.p1  ORF type:complete len:319 (+),score=85.98 TRINITY_DN159_c0_g1_i2:79-1035(+)